MGVRGEGKAGSRERGMADGRGRVVVSSLSGRDVSGVTHVVGLARGHAQLQSAHFTAAFGHGVVQRIQAQIVMPQATLGVGAVGVKERPCVLGCK